MAGKILRVHIESFMGVEDRDIEMDEFAILALIADGGAGKTSIVEFFKAALTGTIPDTAINTKTGKAKGSLEFLGTDNNKYTVDFTKTKKSETVKIRSSNNMQGGKDVLRSVVGNVLIDPFRLQGLEPDKQVLEFKKMCKIDTRELDKEISAVEEERAAIGRNVDNLTGYLLKDEEYSLDMEAKVARYEKEKELDGRVEKRNKAIEDNNERVKVESAVASLRSNVISYLESIRENEAEIETLRQKIAQYQEKNIATKRNVELIEQSVLVKEDWLNENPEKDVESINKEIDEINEFNKERLQFLNYVEKYRERQSEETKYQEKNKEIADKRRAKEELVTSFMAKLDMPNLKFYEKQYDDKKKVIDDREGLYWLGKNGERPLSMLSTTEIMDFGVQLKHALDNADGKPGLPVLIMDDFESVGKVGRDTVVKLCQEGKYQAIVAIMDLNETDLKIVLKNDLNFETTQAPAKEAATS